MYCTPISRKHSFKSKQKMPTSSFRDVKFSPFYYRANKKNRHLLYDREYRLLLNSRLNCVAVLWIVPLVYILVVPLQTQEVRRNSSVMTSVRWPKKKVFSKQRDGTLAIMPDYEPNWKSENLLSVQVPVFQANKGLTSFQRSKTERLTVPTNDNPILKLPFYVVVC